MTPGGHFTHGSNCVSLRKAAPREMLRVSLLGVPTELTGGISIN